MRDLLKKLLTDIKAEQGLDFEFDLNYPQDASHGHYATNLALIAAKQLKKNPREVAEDLLKALESRGEFKEKFSAEIAGPGFINFRIKPTALVKNLAESAGQEQVGSTKSLQGKKIMIEYAQPNPFKAMHIGHLRNIIIGEAAARVMEKAGAKVIRTNYQGDVGLHVAKCFWGMHHRSKDDQQELKTIDERVNYLAECYVAGSKAYKEDEAAKEEIHDFNKRIWDREKPENAEIKKEWEEKRQWSLDKFEEVYQRLGVKFDRLYFESEMERPGMARAEEAREQGILIEDDGCLIFDGEKHGLNKRVFVNKLGLPTYEAKELGLAFREVKDFGEIDRVIHVVANEQINFFKITFLVEKLMDEKLFDDKQYHLNYGFVSLKGGKMSSREGNVVLAEDVINAAVEEVMQLLREREAAAPIKREERDEIAEAVGIGAVKYSFLKIGTMKDMTFDLAESVRLEGQSGPYVMYAYVRAKKILAKAGKADGDSAQSAKELNAGIELSPQEERLAVLCLRWPELIERSARDYQLAPVTEFAYELAVAFSNFYDKCPVLNEKDEQRRAWRLELTRACKETLGACLDVMGIERVKKM